MNIKEERFDTKVSSILSFSEAMKKDCTDCAKYFLFLKAFGNVRMKARESY